MRLRNGAADHRRMKPSPLHLISAETAQLDDARKGHAIGLVSGTTLVLGTRILYVGFFSCSRPIVFLRSKTKLSLHRLGLLTTAREQFCVLGPACAQLRSAKRRTPGQTQSNEKLFDL
jgi:hypothetical protein